MRYMPATEHTATLVSFKLSSNCKPSSSTRSKASPSSPTSHFVLGYQSDDGRCCCGAGVIPLDLRAREAVHDARAFLLQLQYANCALWKLTTPRWTDLSGSKRARSPTARADPFILALRRAAGASGFIFFLEFATAGVRRLRSARARLRAGGGLHASVMSRRHKSCSVYPLWQAQN